MTGAVFNVDALLELARLPFPAVTTAAFTVRPDTKCLSVVVAVLLVSAQGILTSLAGEAGEALASAASVGVPKARSPALAVAINCVCALLKSTVGTFPSLITGALTSLLLSLVGFAMTIAIRFPGAPLQLTLETSECRIASA